MLSVRVEIARVSGERKQGLNSLRLYLQPHGHGVRQFSAAFGRRLYPATGPPVLPPCHPGLRARASRHWLLPSRDLCLQPRWRACLTWRNPPWAGICVRWSRQSFCSVRRETQVVNRCASPERAGTCFTARFQRRRRRRRGCSRCSERTLYLRSMEWSPRWRRV